MSKDCPKKVNELAEQPTDGNLGGLFMSALGASDVIRRNAVHRTGRELRFGIDSGAAVTATPEFVEQYPFAEPSNGLKYQSATGESIPDLDMKKPFIDVKGDQRGVRARIARIKRPLMSVYDMYMAGHRVVFDRDEFGNDISHAVHKETGKTAKFTLRNRTWDLDAKLVPHSDLRVEEATFCNSFGSRSIGITLRRAM